MLISPVQPMMSVHRLQNGHLLNNGYCASFAQDLQPILTQLPRLPNEVDIIIIQKKNKENINKQYICDKNRIIRIIKFMEKHNKLWLQHGCKLNEERLDSLPEYGVPEGLPIIQDENDVEPTPKDNGPEILQTSDLEDDSNDQLDEDEQCYIEIDNDELQQVNKIRATINLPITEKVPVNEYELSGILTLAFPKLFPLGNADPTNKIRLNYVSETEAYRHLIKYVCKDSNGELYYPYTSHPRFLFYVSDRLRRHRTLNQSKVYLKQNNEDASLTIQELKEIISKNDSELNGMIKRMSAYSANITGSDAFWHRRKLELQATFEQKKTATAFFTISYADMHLSDLHRLMPGKPATTKTERYKNCLKNPHIVDWFFSFRLNKFLEVIFDEILEAEWRWHRYEWQKRTAIHAHGCVKLKNDPDLIKLTSIVYIGKKSLQQFPLTQNKINQEQELLQNILNGVIAEQKVVSYVDTLVTAMNPSDYTLLQNNVPEPHPCCIDINLLDQDQYDQDYINLVNCCQRHICRIPGYCIKQSKKKEKDCRFGFPFELQTHSTIEFSETLTRVLAEIKLKRNDPWMNAHNKLITHHWRGNTDLQAILDAKSAKDYIAKYATKCEVVGSYLTEIIKTVALTITPESNPVSKLKSIFLRTTCAKRDRGLGEVTRSLLGNPLYHSTFKYENLSLDMNNRSLVEINGKEDESAPAVKKNLLDFYGERNMNPHLLQILEEKKIVSLIEFAKYFHIIKQNLVPRKNPENIIIITTPSVTYNNQDIKKYSKYCFYQFIKYGPWDSKSIKDLTLNNSIDTWNSFITTAPPEIRESVEFTVQLAERLNELRKEQEEDDYEQLNPRRFQTDFSSFNELNGEVFDFEEAHAQIDKNYDWDEQNKLFTEEQITQMQGWIEQQKLIHNEEIKMK